MEQTVVKLAKLLVEAEERARDAEAKVQELNIELMERDYRIDLLESELASLKGSIGTSGE
jgi:hypothetical protein